MPTSQTSLLSKPVGDDPIPLGTLGYFRARTKQRMYNLVLREFKKSGVSKADLARRLRKTAAQMSRTFGGPGNWTLDTVSDLLFAIGGGELASSISYPLEKPTRNYRAPDWLESWNKIGQAARENQPEANTFSDPISRLSGPSPPPKKALPKPFDLTELLR
jgi:hypothetical protein